jgi:hypothetical protein
MWKRKTMGKMANKMRLVEGTREEERKGIVK